MLDLPVLLGVSPITLQDFGSDNHQAEESRTLSSAFLQQSAFSRIGELWWQQSAHPASPGVLSIIQALTHGKNEPV